MAENIRSWTLGELGAMVGAYEIIEPEKVILRGAPAGEGDPDAITFAGDQRYLDKCLVTDVGAIIVSPSVGGLRRPCLVVSDPRVAFFTIMAAMIRPIPAYPGIHPTALTDPDAKIHDSVRIGPYAVIESGAEIHAGAVIHAHGYIGEGCSVGQKSVLMPRVTLIQDVQIGARCLLHSGVVIGADGFGFVWTGEKHQKIPQVGGVVVEDDVEIGANTCIDRATVGVTRIGRGTKLDNLIQIGHNVKMGADNVMAGQAGVAGSATIGARVTTGGQVAIGDHMEVTDDVILGGRTGVMSNIADKGTYFGTPPVPIHQAMRAMALQQRMPELFKRLRELESRLARLTPREDDTPQ
jgi:UDP-3-O-[3-hydroxymyristoyl] glucosamine N-acyltransferase